MDPTEKRKFVADLFRAVETSIQSNIDKMPDNWDGHELREYIADRFDAERSTLMQKSGRRMSDYRNFIAISTL